MAKRSLLCYVLAFPPSHVCSLVNTRCIFYRIRANRADPDNFTLCPVLDFANHSNGGSCIFPVVDSGIWSVVSKKPLKHFTFFGPSQEAIPEGQELFLQYGDHSNSFLFAEYGFVNEVPDGATKGGAYAGQVDVQELVEELFAEWGPVGIRMKSALQDEGYWGYVPPAYIWSTKQVANHICINLAVTGRSIVRQLPHMLRTG